MFSFLMLAKQIENHNSAKLHGAKLKKFFQNKTKF